MSTPRARRSSRPSMHIVMRLFVAVAPLLLTSVFAWLVMESHLNFGGGEKDIFLALPLLLWSLLFLLCSLVLWRRRSALGRSVAVSSGLAAALVAIAWLVLFGVSWFSSG